MSLLEQILRARSPEPPPPRPRGERMAEKTRKLNVVFKKPGHCVGRCTVHSRREKDTEVGGGARRGWGRCAEIDLCGNRKRKECSGNRVHLEDQRKT